MRPQSILLSWNIRLYSAWHFPPSERPEFKIDRPVFPADRFFNRVWIKEKLCCEDRLMKCILILKNKAIYGFTKSISISSPGYSLMADRLSCFRKVQNYFKTSKGLFWTLWISIILFYFVCLFTLFKNSIEFKLRFRMISMSNYPNYKSILMSDLAASVKCGDEGDCQEHTRQPSNWDLTPAWGAVTLRN